MTDASNVVQIGDLLLARKKDDYMRQREGCKHVKLEMDDVGETVKCRDCGVYVSAYWALGMLRELWGDHAKKVKRELSAVQEERGALLHLTAAKLAETAWRSRTTVPTCPHCRRGVFAEDRFGSATVSKVFEQGLRVREQAESAEKGTPFVAKLAPGKPKTPKAARKPRSKVKPAPKWENAPAWAQWLTQDAAGKWTWHVIEPFLNGKGDGFESGGQTAFAGTTAVPADGVCIKQKRPKIEPECVQ